MTRNTYNFLNFFAEGRSVYTLPMFECMRNLKYRRSVMMTHERQNTAYYHYTHSKCVALKCLTLRVFVRTAGALLLQMHVRYWNLAVNPIIFLFENIRKWMLGFHMFHRIHFPPFHKPRAPIIHIKNQTWGQVLFNFSTFSYMVISR